jgi:UDP:flavonoid glycosyltransferase YjiC (YdhE family)
VRIFISHRALLSIMETVYHGVPIIDCIPVFTEHKTNIASTVNNGFAVSVPLTEITDEKLSWAINEILNNPR